MPQMRRGRNRLLSAAVLLACCGCGSRIPSAQPFAAGEPETAVTFRDASAEAGVDFQLGHRDRTPLTILETANGGCAFLDYDADGRLDLLLVGQPRCALYRNRGGGRFKEVTDQVGLGGK